MSGRWRSRYADEGEGLLNHHQNPVKNNEGGGGSSNHRSWIRHRNDDRGKDDVEKEWRRGQTLPSTNDIIAPTPQLQKNEQVLGVSKKSNTERRDPTPIVPAARAAAPAPVRPAWGGASASLSSTNANANANVASKKTNDDEKNDEKAKVLEGEKNEGSNKHKKTAWAAPDPSPPVKLLRRQPDGASSSSSSSSSITLSTSITITKKNEATSANPWSKEVVPTIAPTVPLDGKSPGKANGVPAKGVPTSSSASLPTGASWGKVNSRQQQQQKKQQQQPPPASRKKVEEFPSLSVASKMADRPMQQTVTTKTNVTIIPELSSSPSSSSKKKADKSNKNNKVAPVTSLASFLSPPVAMTGNSSKKKNRLSTQSNTSLSSKPGVVTSGKAGVKRSASAPSSATAMANDERLGGEFLTTGMKKVIARGGKLQRQGVPGKKKLTSLKKKVLRERLRMWKEKNGITDNGSEVVAAGSDDGEAEKEELLVKVNDVDDDDRPSAKCPRTGSTPGEAPLLLSLSVDKVPKSMTSSRTLLVENFVRPEEDDLLDDDEYEEIMSNLVELASRVGRVITTFIPRPSSHSSSSDDEVDCERRHIGSAIVRFASDVETQAARDVLGGIVVGGQRLRTLVLDTNELDRLPIENDTEWRAAVLRILDHIRSSSSAADEGQDRQSIDQCDTQMSDVAMSMEIVFHGILSDDDYKDDEALRESIEDIKALSEQYGQVVGARGSTSGNDRGNVYIIYTDERSADMAVKQLNGIVIGGSKIMVRRSNINSSQSQEQFVTGEIVLINALNDDDLEDEECLHECLKDIRTLAEQHGNVSFVNAIISGDQKGSVRVLYVGGHEVALHAAEKLNGLMMGGFALSVLAVPHTTNDDLLSKDETAATPPLQPMYSGNKILSATFAECKRVPKVPNAGIPRAYASQIPDERAVILLTEMLGELIRLQERSKDDKNARARRRIVMGLREVARGIRAHKVKMIVMANNLDEYGAIDTKLQEILDLARVEGLPVLYELNKRKLGKALGKSIKVSVVGIQNADGAHEQFKKLKKMLGYL